MYSSTDPGQVQYRAPASKWKPGSSTGYAPHEVEAERLLNSRAGETVTGLTDGHCTHAGLLWERGGNGSHGTNEIRRHMVGSQIGLKESKMKLHWQGMAMCKEYCAALIRLMRERNQKTEQGIDMDLQLASSQLSNGSRWFKLLA